MIEWVLALLFSLILGFLTIALRIHTKSWLSPSGIIAGFWFLLTILPLLIASNTPINAYSVGYIILPLLCFV